MVSLGEDSRRTSGYLFDSHNASYSVHGSDEILCSSLGVAAEPRFHRLRTPAVVAVLILTMMVQEVLLFATPVFCDHYQCLVPPSSAILYSHAVIWMLFFVSDRILQRQHLFLRKIGYLEFYRRTRNLRSLPLHVCSAGSVLLLVLVTCVGDYCATRQSATDCPRPPFTTITCLQILVSLEMVAILVLLVIYLVRTVRFNRSKPVADVHQEDMFSSGSHSLTPSQDIGFRDGEMLDELMEKQADMIRYLRQHNAYLGKKILELSGHGDT